MTKPFRPPNAAEIPVAQPTLSPGPIEFVSYPTVDPVRATALRCAARVACGVFTSNALQDAVIDGWILSLAREFEAYLRGDKDDAPAPQPPRPNPSTTVYR